jgi:hypothetical protein
MFTESPCRKLFTKKSTEIDMTVSLVFCLFYRIFLGASQREDFKRTTKKVLQKIAKVLFLIPHITDKKSKIDFPYLGTISRKTSDSTDKFNGQNPLDIAITNALELLRGQNFEN